MFCEKTLLKTSFGAINKKTMEDDLKEVKKTPLPWERVSLIGLILLGNTFSLVMTFPFLPFMVHDFFPDLKQSQLGYKAGFLGSAFSFGSLFASYLWGSLADRIGRKPVLLSGLCGTFVAIIAFGMSKTFSLALISRFFWGLLNGNIGVAKTYLSEILDDSNLAQGFSVIGLQGGFGRLLGPALGGILSKPADKYPSFDNPFFREFPYLLPCLTAAAISALGFIGTLFFLQETLDTSRKHNSQIDINEVRDPISPLISPMDPSNKFQNQEKLPLLSKIKPHKTCWELVQDKKIRVTCGLYGLVAAVGIMGNEIFPLWALNDAAHGGYNFTSQEIGLVYMISAPSEIIFQLTLYSKMVKYLGGPQYALQLGVLVQGVCYFLLPFTSSTLSLPSWIQWTVLCCLFNITVLSQLSCFTSVFVLITNSAPRSIRGRVNGLGQTVASFARVLSPPTASIIFAWSEENQLVFPFNFHFIFNLLSFLCVLTFLYSKSLPHGINCSPTE